MPVTTRQFYIDDVLQDQISGSVNWQQKSYTISTTDIHRFRWDYMKDGDGTQSGSDCGWVDYVQWTQTGTQVAALAQAVDSSLTFTTGGKWWYRETSTYYYGGDAAQSGDGVADNGQSWMQTTVSVQSQGSVIFYWKVSSQSNCDWLEFYIDGTRQDRISGTVDWQQKSYTISTAGSHTLKWRYVKDASGSAGSDCGWVDAVQWLSPEQPPSVISYVYDPSGRRIEKQYDGLTQMKFLYDGDHIISEYSQDGSLLHKYIYGPGVDQPICMIDVANSSATYYYHFDGLGSVVALTNSSGSTVEVYEYSVYGQVGASDATHPNRFMFTGREFDKDTGLYYYRARYYNPYIGRFLQTDPGGEGMNAYAYCSNNTVNRVDPLGLLSEFYQYYADEARTHSVRNTDPVGYDGYHNSYYGQNLIYNCAPIALANLYIASGQTAVNQVVAKMRVDESKNDKDPSLVGRYSDRDLAYSLMFQYFQDYLEVKTVNGVTWRNNVPLNTTAWMADKNWNESGIEGLKDVKEIINEVGGIGSYQLVTDSHDHFNAIEHAVRDLRKPIIIGFRLHDGGENYGVDYHTVVVRYQEDAQSLIDGEWVKTPYEVVDGANGVYEQLYFTPGTFMKLVQGLSDQAVIPAGR